MPQDDKTLRAEVGPPDQELSDQQRDVIARLKARKDNPQLPSYHRAFEEESPPDIVVDN